MTRSVEKDLRAIEKETERVQKLVRELREAHSASEAYDIGLALTKASKDLEKAASASKELEEARQSAV